MMEGPIELIETQKGKNLNLNHGVFFFLMNLYLYILYCANIIQINT